LRAPAHHFHALRPQTVGWSGLTGPKLALHTCVPMSWGGFFSASVCSWPKGSRSSPRKSRNGPHVLNPSSSSPPSGPGPRFQHRQPRPLRRNNSVPAVLVLHLDHPKSYHTPLKRLYAPPSSRKSLISNGLEACRPSVTQVVSAIDTDTPFSEHNGRGNENVRNVCL